MCIDMHVTLPVVGSFLMLYSLRHGCIVILVWTLIRTIFCLIFFTVVILEGLVKRNTPFGPLFVHTENATTDGNIFFVYYCSLLMIIGESFLFIFCYYFILGLHCVSSKPLTQYLICRFITWLIEATNVFILIIVHKLLVGWYLGILLFVILEFYGFIVVYSYYMDLREEESHECKPCY